MSRSFAAEDLVVLPRLDVQDAITLGAELSTAAKASKKAKLPKAVAASLKTTLAAHGALVKVAASVEERLGADPEAVRLADQALDGGWSALAGFLEGWARLPDAKKPGAKAPEAVAAQAVLGKLFPDGLRFTMMAFKVEWAESETRLRRLRTEKLDKQIEALGGKRFLEVIAAVHARYGELLGITKAGAEATDPQLGARDALLAFTGALRRMVVQVSAFAAEGGTSEKVQTCPGSSDLRGGQVQTCPGSSDLRGGQVQTCPGSSDLRGGQVQTCPGSSDLRGWAGPDLPGVQRSEGVGRSRPARGRPI